MGVVSRDIRPASSGELQDAYYRTRFSHAAGREKVWGVICRYLERYLPPRSMVLDLGAGYCSFINQVRASEKYALDLFPGFVAYAAPGVRTHVGPCWNLTGFGDGQMDVVFTSNLLEHLSRTEVLDTLNEVRRVLKPGGRFVIIQPNFRYCAPEVLRRLHPSTRLQPRVALRSTRFQGIPRRRHDPALPAVDLQEPAAAMVMGGGVVPPAARSPHGEADAPGCDPPRGQVRSASSLMWQGRTVSVALPTYNERESIRECIEGFFGTGIVDEVVVCNNNAAPGTSEEIAKTHAREVFEKRQGYGWSCRKALAETKGDIIVLAEPDGSFDPGDVHKLLAYADDFDVVLGSRTNRELIWTGANMGFFMKWANWAVAKYSGIPIQRHDPQRRRLHHAPAVPAGARANPAVLRRGRIALRTRDDHAVHHQRGARDPDPGQLQRTRRAEHGLREPVGRGGSRDPHGEPDHPGAVGELAAPIVVPRRRARSGDDRE